MASIGVSMDLIHGQTNTEDGPIETTTEVFFVEAVTERGDRYALVGFDTADRDEAEARAATATFGGEDDEAWVRVGAVYGSEAWGQEDEYDLACFEADAYDEPRPNWF